MAAPQWHAPLIARLDQAELDHRTAWTAPGGGQGAMYALTVSQLDIARVMETVAERSGTPELIRRLLTHGSRAMAALSRQMDALSAAHAVDDEPTGWADQEAVDAVDQDQAVPDGARVVPCPECSAHPWAPHRDDCPVVDADESTPPVTDDHASPVAGPLDESEQQLVAEVTVDQDVPAEPAALEEQPPVDPVADAQSVAWDLYLDTASYPIPADLERHVAAAQLLADEVDEYQLALDAVRSELSLPEHPPGLPLAERRARTRREVGDAIEQLHTGVDQIATALGIQVGASLAEVVAEAHRLRELVRARAEPGPA